MIGFSYHGMLSRIILAALHFNENALRGQATTIDGRKKYDVIFSKFKKEDYYVREVKVDCTYAEDQTMNSSGVMIQSDVPPPLCSSYQQPDEETTIQEKTFQTGQHF
ncbi:uncharacterized protein LOC144626352 [Crassostrea virginica]